MGALGRNLQSAPAAYAPKLSAQTRVCVCVGVK